MIAAFSAFRGSLRRVFGLALLGHRNSRVLARQLERAMGMLAAPLIIEAASAALLIYRLWGIAPRTMLCAWGAAVALSVVASIEYYRRFALDKDKVARIRFWLRAQLAHSLCAGLIWGFAGSVFPFQDPGIVALVSTVAAVVAVALGSWPFYAMWLPGLAAFAFLSIGTTALALVGNYFISDRVYASVFFFAIIAAILYAGMKLNELMTASILAEAENQKLMRRLERERNAAEAARRKAEEDNRRRAAFFRAANHDLRQPLQAMGIYLQILGMKKTPDTAPVLEQLSLCSKSLSTLVEQILEVSRMNADNFEVNRELISVPDFLESLAREFGPVAAERGIRFAIRPQPLLLDTDPQLAARAVRNLVSNAIKYCDKEKGWVCVAAKKLPDGRVRLSVYDNGPGISKEDREKVFHSFFRGASGKAGPSGFGLGLAIVRGICGRLGIGLSVASRVGRGTVFRMEFGAAAAGEPAGVVPSGAEAEASEMKPLPARVLYLEDNVTVSRSVSELLKAWGAETVQAPFLNDELIERMKGFRPEVLLTDFDLGEGVPNGIESCLALSHALKNAIPAVILTAVPEEQIELEWQKRMPTRGLAEMPEILRKPAAEAALSAALRRALASRNRGTPPPSAPMPL